MSEFLGLYQKALDYIKFFADPKQLKGFDKAIELYQDSLKSTGDTVVTIRKFIKKMIKDFLKLKDELANMGVVVVVFDYHDYLYQEEDNNVNPEDLDLELGCLGVGVVS